jgi:uncharacterized repeat protein (TIGR03803 family)
MKKLFVILIFTLISSLFTLCKAQYSVLLDFDLTNGDKPYGSLTPLGKELYGMTFYGNNIFSIDTSGNGFKNLLNFNGADGARPTGSLILSGGVFYGMTEDGGANGYGNIFSIDTNGNNIKDLFDFDGTNGKNPFGSLILSGKVLYGMTELGLPPHIYGNIFSIDTDGSNFKVLLYFNDTNGAYPDGTLTLSGKILYGMTFGGGTNNIGCVFSIDTDGNGYKDLLNFNGTNGAEPEGSLVYATGVLYGMTSDGGANFDGCVFSIDTNGTRYKDLFDFNGSNGWLPYGDLTLSGSLLFGMTYYGGLGITVHSNGYGCIFSIDTNGTRFKNLFYFDSINGELPFGDLTISGSVLYGMTSEGGANGEGVVFKLDTTNIGSSIKQFSVVNSQFSVYPNPNDGKFTVACHSKRSEESQLNIYNIIGECIFTESLRFACPNGSSGRAQGDNSVDLSNQPNGIYLYRVIKEDGNLVGSGKVVIEK